MPGSDKSTKSATPADAAPHYHGHRVRLRQRFLQAGSDALHDYEMLELILFRAIPRRDVKPLAKELLKKFGSLAEVIAAVCTKNFIHFDCVRESHNVSDDGCAILLLSGAVGFAVQVE
jgi:hypothetical protein